MWTIERVFCFPILLYVLSDLPALIWNGPPGFAIVYAPAFLYLPGLASLGPDG